MYLSDTFKPARQSHRLTPSLQYSITPAIYFSFVISVCPLTLKIT
jgi:hypothetical protein